MSRPVAAIFAGSGTPKDSAILDAARTFGANLAAAGFDVIYGGGKLGIMGAAAESAAKAGAHITAVVLKKYAHEEQIAGAAQIHVDTEADRFKLLSTHNNPAALFVLPGGPGALREAIQGLETAVYEDGAPVVLVQTGAYLDGIKNYFDMAVSAGLIRSDRQNKLQTVLPAGDLSVFLPKTPGNANPALDLKV